MMNRIVSEKLINMGMESEYLSEVSLAEYKNNKEYNDFKLLNDDMVLM